MSEFKIDPTFLSTLSEEQKKSLNETLLQHSNFMKKDTESSFETRLTNEKSKWEQEYQNKATEIEKTKTWLSTIKNEKDRVFAQELLDLGQKPETIQEKHNDWFIEGTKTPGTSDEPEDKKKTVLDLEALINGLNGEIQKASGNKSENDEAFLARIQKEGIADDDTESWERYDKLSQKQ